MIRVEAEATRTLDLLELPFLESAALANLSYSPQPYSAGGYAANLAIGSGHIGMTHACQVQSVTLFAMHEQAGHRLGNCTAQQAGVLLLESLFTSGKTQCL